MPSFEDPDKLTEFLNMSKTQNDTISSYSFEATTSLKDIFEEGVEDATAELQLNFSQFYKIGALLGFWPNTTKYDNGGGLFPEFLKKKFEYVTYSENGDIIRQYSIFVPDSNSMQPAELDIFGHIAVLFIKHTIQSESFRPWTSGQPGRLFWKMPDGITLCVY